MRLSFVTALTLASVSFGLHTCPKNAWQVPSCAKPCISHAAMTVGCGAMDYACQCKKAVLIAGAAQHCVYEACKGHNDGPLNIFLGVESICACSNSEYCPCARQEAAVPTCANSCRSSAATAVGCHTSDYQCQCSKSKEINTRLSACAERACDCGYARVTSSVNNLCKCVKSAHPATTTTTTTTTTPTTTTPTITPPPCTASACDAAALAVPSCAQSCYVSAGSAAGCQETDFACQCSSSAAIASAVSPCVSNACPSSSYAAVLSSESALCSCATSSEACASATATP